MNEMTTEALARRFGAGDVVMIDGRSGSGKTRLAESLASVFAERGAAPVQMLRVEDLYPGWDGLEAGATSLAQVLRDERYRPYDWLRGEFGQSVGLARTRPLIVEGCGALSASNLAAADAWLERSAGRGRTEGNGAVRSVWMTGPEELRRRRALARDGETYRPHWNRWADQEERLYARTTPWLLAETVLHLDEAGRLVEC